MPKYIYQYPSWPMLLWEHHQFSGLLGNLRWMQGRMQAQMEALGFDKNRNIALQNLTSETTASSAIEGENLNEEAVRSSIARRLGMDLGGTHKENRYVEGVVEMMLNATLQYKSPLSSERLFGWHAALFPTGYSGAYKIEVGRYRSGEMQIVSGAMGKEKLHYEAVPAKDVQKEMELFLEWIHANDGMDLVLKAAVAHFRFIIIHPFDDGNGRMARAITEWMLCRSEQSGERYYSLSSAILARKKEYYAMLQKVQHSSGDITKWLVWFFDTLKIALQQASTTLDEVQKKHTYWEKHKDHTINARQNKMINKLFDGLDGALTTTKWAKMTKVSQDTALRDIQDLLQKHMLVLQPSGGRSTHYTLPESNF